MIHSIRRARLFAGAGLGAVALLALTPAAQAQTAGTVSEVEVLASSGETISLTAPTATGSRLGITILQTPASISTLTGAMIRARGDLSVIDAVSRMTGITSVANPGNGGTALAARGFNGQGSVMQLFDGVRLFPVAGTITFPADPWNIDHIEALSGPASVLYGQGALGGAVNVITKAPNTQRQEFQGEAGYGSQNTWHVAGGAGGPVSDQLSYRVDGSYRRSDGYVDRGDSKSYALSGAIRFAPTENFTVTLRDDYGNNRPMEYFGTPLINSRLDDSIRHRNYNVGDADLHYRDNRTALTVEWKASEALSFTNVAYRLTSKRLFKDLESYCWVASDGFCPNGYNGDPQTPGNIFRTDNFGIFHDNTQIGDTGSFKFSSDFGGGMKNDLVGGFDINRIKLTYSNDFDSDIQENSVNPFNFNPGLYGPGPGLFQQDIAPRFKTRTVEYALFLEDRLALTDQFSVVGGVRTEHDDVRRFNINPAGVVSPQVFSKRIQDTTWRVGGVYQPTPDVSLYGQYSTGVDPLGTLTTYSGSQTQFQNAHGHQVEAGVKASFLDGRGSATFAAYKIVKNDLLSQRTLSSPIEQVGQRSAKGLEASIAVQLPQGFGIDANGTILDAKYDDFRSGGAVYTGNTPPNVPEAAANLWLSWKAMDRFEARAGLRYVGRTFSDNANDFRIPAYAVVDGGATYAFTSNLALEVHVYNVFDKKYATTTYNDEQWILGRPRSVDVALKARF